MLPPLPPFLPRTVPVPIFVGVSPRSVYDLPLPALISAVEKIIIGRVVTGSTRAIQLPPFFLVFIDPEKGMAFSGGLLQL